MRKMFAGWSGFSGGCTSAVLGMALVLGAAAFGSGCASVGYNSQTGAGWIYTNHYEGAMVTDHSSGRKRGQACTINYVGLVTTGDASVSAAMKDGAITTVSSIDRSYSSILGVYGKMCTIVTGN